MQFHLRRWAWAIKVPTGAADEDDDGVRRRLQQTLIAAIAAAIDGDGPQVGFSLVEQYLAAIKVGYRKPLEEFRAERLHECEAPSASPPPSVIAPRRRRCWKK